MRNRYGGTCYKCGAWVPPGFGFFEKNHGQFYGARWRVQCVKCCDGREVKPTDKEVIRAVKMGEEKKR